MERGAFLPQFDGLPPGARLAKPSLSRDGRNAIPNGPTAPRAVQHHIEVQSVMRRKRIGLIQQYGLDTHPSIFSSALVH